MFTMAAQSMGYRVMVLDPGIHSPAGAVADHHLCADYLDPQALKQLGTSCAAVTTEFENAPAEALDQLAEQCIVAPSAHSVAIAQDRVREKTFLSSSGIGVAPYAVIQTESDLRASLDPGLFPGILKLSRLGYDGKGQARVNTVSEAIQVFRNMKGKPCVLEKQLSLKLEISVVFARTSEGEVVTYTPSENQHVNGILDMTIVPARIASDLADAARAATVEAANKMNYCGVGCIEFFVLEDGRLLANEIAPRPHNSGHYTIDATVTSQFEQQARALARLPLGSVTQHSPAVMINLLGDLWKNGEPDWNNVLSHPSTKLHLYGKSEARPGRKMGHSTCLDQQLDQAINEALKIKRALSVKIF
jgi:5-(carboxyamino)imidazole ribonucleotide synthase